nr:hypothetical protein JVH1_1084 [Rhodococcus sp. JVH1]
MYCRNVSGRRPESVERGPVTLVLILVELLRQLMERAGPAQGRARRSQRRTDRADRDDTDAARGPAWPKGGIGSG